MVSSTQFAPCPAEYFSDHEHKTNHTALSLCQPDADGTIKQEGKENGMDARIAAYVVDTTPGYYTYAEQEGMGQCRSHFARLVADLDAGRYDVVMVAAARLFFVETSPLWMEQLIAIVKRRGVRIVDVTADREYDLRSAADETAFRQQGTPRHNEASER
jgi:hypothetical protein